MAEASAPELQQLEPPTRSLSLRFLACLRSCPVVPVVLFVVFIGFDASKGLVVQWADMGRSDTSRVKLESKEDVDLVAGALADEKLNRYFLGVLRDDVEVSNRTLAKGWWLMASRDFKGADSVKALAELKPGAALEFAHPRKPVATVQVFVNAVVSMAIGVCLAAVGGGVPLMKECVNPRTCISVLPISALFNVAKIAGFQALYELDAGTFKLLLQLGLPMTAVFSTPILRRRYTFAQWEGLAMITLSAAAFSIAKYRTMRGGDSNIKLGIFYALVSVGLGCLGSVVAERFLKKTQFPFYVQKVQLDVGGSAFGALMVFVYPYVNPMQYLMLSLHHRGFFAGWTWKTLVVSAVWISQAWLSGFLAKKFSSVLKKVAQCITSIIVFILSALMSDLRGVDKLICLLAVVVVVSVHQFIRMAPPDTRGDKAAPDKEPEALSHEQAVIAKAMTVHNVELTPQASSMGFPPMDRVGSAPPASAREPLL